MATHLRLALRPDMKFGKHLRKARERSNPQWSNYWVDYKMLKRLVKAAAAAGVTGGDAAPPALGALHPARSVGPEGGLTPVRTRSASHLPWDLRGAPASIPEERAFFSAMLQNLSKVSAFYGRSIQRHEAQVATLCDEVAREARSDANGGAVGSERRRGRAASATDLLARCRDVYLDLLMLEQFAVLNYCGFSKILKKHDKCTGCAAATAPSPHQQHTNRLSACDASGGRRERSIWAGW